MRDYLNRLRQQFQRFMIGRYGMDQFGRFLSGVLLALIIFNLLIPAALPSRILWALEWIVLIILYARMFSKNINKRYQENEAFLRRQFYVSEWWKQLFGESEGKDQKGLFPASVDLTTDLHSMGQFIQDGSRIMFETVMELENPSLDVTINEEPVDLDGLNYLSGKTLDFINKSAMKGTQLAHTDGNVPNLSVKLPKQDEFSLGQLFYFFEFACGVSGYILGVNPFNQPGVESYKANLFALRGKPGYDAQREELMKRL